MRRTVGSLTVILYHAQRKIASPLSIFSTFFFISSENGKFWQATVLLPAVPAPPPRHPVRALLVTPRRARCPHRAARQTHAPLVMLRRGVVLPRPLSSYFHENTAENRKFLLHFHKLRAKLQLLSVIIYIEKHLRPPMGGRLFVDKEAPGSPVRGRSKGIMARRTPCLNVPDLPLRADGVMPGSVCPLRQRSGRYICGHRW